MKKAVLYVRVSSKEQKEEGYSIPAQKKLLRAYAEKNGFKVAAVFEEAETAKRAGRKEFRTMLQFLKNNEDVQDILVEKTDRLSRNLRDYVDVGDLGRNVHYVKEGQIMGPQSRAADKLIHDIKLALAKNYVDNLSEETKKGMQEKAEQGLYPSFAPLGYVNDSVTGEIRVDFKRASIIREMFEIYAAGGVYLRELTAIAAKKGLVSRTGRKIQKSQTAKMLQNPIYIGDFLWKDVYHRGSHEAIVSRELFEKVSGVLHSKQKPRKQKRDFAFRGLLKCGVCGCTITAEIKKGRYVYYRCTRSRQNCSERAVREEDLVLTLGEPLKRLRIDSERLDWILKSLKESYEGKKNFRKTEINRLQAEYEQIESKIDRLYEDKLSDVVSAEFWKRKYNELIGRQSRIKDQIEEHDFANESYLKDAEGIFELAKDAYRLYLNRNPFDQRKLLDMLLSNCTLKGGQVSYEFKEPYRILVDGAEEEERMIAENLPKSAINKIWLPRLDSNFVTSEPSVDKSPCQDKRKGGPIGPPFVDNASRRDVIPLTSIPDRVQRLARRRTLRV